MEMMRATTLAGVAIAAGILFDLKGMPSAVEIHVSPSGSDTADGCSAATPFATLVHARDAVRALKKNGPLPKGGVAVFLHGGVYRISKTLELSEEDSGEPGAPVAWRAWKNERPILTGAIEIPRFDAKPDPEVMRRLKPAARADVVCADIRALGYTDTSPLHSYGYYRKEDDGGRPVTDVYADGELVFSLDGNETVEVVRSGQNALVVELEGYDPCDVMCRKIGWRGTGSL